MSLQAPYLLMGFDVEASDPQRAQILSDVEHNVPFKANPNNFGRVGENRVWYLDVPQPSAVAAFQNLSTYFSGKDVQWGGRLSWFVQLCRSTELSGS